MSLSGDLELVDVGDVALFGFFNVEYRRLLFFFLAL